MKTAGSAILALIFSFLLPGITGAWEERAATTEPTFSFPLDLKIVDPGSPDKLPPYIVMFEKGTDKAGQDVRGPLGRLEALRGASKMFPASNDDAGLPVVLRGLRFHALVSSEAQLLGYQVELQGEFNMVKVDVSKPEMEKFLSGELTTFTLRGTKNYGIFAYESSVKMECRLIGKKELVVYKIIGDFNFREGFYTYTSATKQLTPPAGRSYLYRGHIERLPDLPSI